MSESKNIYILGYSGHAYVVIESALTNNHKIKGYFDFRANEDNPFKLDFFGNENETDLTGIVGEDYIFPAVGSNIVRRKLFDLIEKHQLGQICIIDKSANVSGFSSIGMSTFISAGAIVNSMSTIGKCCIINSGSIVEHECLVDDFSHIAPGAVLLGNVQVGKGVFIGANSVIKEGVSIGDNTIIGAGSVVLKDLPDNTKWVGNPVRKI